MKTVRLSFDEDLLKRVDHAAKRLGTTRSAFAHTALRELLDRLAADELKHRRGYEARPVSRAEFDVWETEQVWPE